LIVLLSRSPNRDRTKTIILGWHVPRHGETALQAICEGFDSLLVHAGKL
jgi:hypothetical protein